MLRKLLLEERIIGDVLSVVHTEPVGWWHFAHSYVRGNWRRESTTAPSLLTKSCHDIDILLWLLCSPTSYSIQDKALPHLPSTVSSTGSLQYFKAARKPVAAGNATNCLSCPIEQSCKYSAKKIYAEQEVYGLDSGNTRWPVSIVVPDIESYGTAEERERWWPSSLTTTTEPYPGTRSAVGLGTVDVFTSPITTCAMSNLSPSHGRMMLHLRPLSRPAWWQIQHRRRT